MIFEYFPNLYEDGLFHDVELEFGDGCIKVSRMILAGHCKFFYDLFTKDITQDKFEIKNLKLADFNVYYEYIHSGSNFKIEGDKIVSLLNVQVELNVPDINAKLLKWIDNPDFIVYLGIYFENTNNSVLKEYNDLSRTLITANFKALSDIKAFDSFSRDNFLKLMNKEFIKDKDQDAILNIITRWVEYDFNNRKYDWLDLVTQLDYSHIGLTLLNEYVQNNQKVFTMPDLMKFFYHKISQKLMAKNLVINNLSKMILFGGWGAKQTIVEVDINSYTVKTVGKLQIGKYYHCSERIGDNVFVLGGLNSKKIERYNLGDKKSEVLSFSMTSNKNYYSSVGHDDKIYVIGGRINSESIDTVEYFEPEKMTWINAPKLLRGVRCHDSALLNGAIYTVGDTDSNKFQRFDPREGKWIFLIDIPNVAYYTALTTFENTITCAGGWNANALCQTYDTRIGKWDQIACLAAPISGGKSIENQNSIIVAGGYNNDSTDVIQAYNKRKNVWDVLDIKLPISNYCSSRIVL